MSAEDFLADRMETPVSEADDEFVTVRKATIGGLSSNLKRWHTRAKNVDQKRKRWRNRALAAEKLVAELRLHRVDPTEIMRQRSLGWPDFHPEAFCHKCGRRNIHSWFSPEWKPLVGSHAGILCPVCFADLDPDVTWVVTRWKPPDTDELERLIGALSGFMDADSEELRRVAGCLLNAGYHHVNAREVA